MSQPIDSLHYVYYKCPNCGDKSDDIRINETRIGKLCCNNCNTIYDIKAIKEVKFIYDGESPAPIKETEKQESYFSYGDSTKQQDIIPVSNTRSTKVINALVNQGYKIKEVESAYSIVLRKNPNIKDDHQELFRQIVTELDDE